MTVNWNDPDIWARAYSIIGRRDKKKDTILPTGAGFGQKLSYLDGRRFALQVADDGLPGLAMFRHHMAKLGAVPAWTPATDVLVVGCGFGGLVEVLLAAGGSNAWGTDTSTLIQANLAGSEMPAEVIARVLNIDVTAPGARAQFQAAGAGTNRGLFRWLVTELVVESLDPLTDPAGFGAFLDALDSLRAAGQGGVAHLVAARLPPPLDACHDTTLGMTWISLAEWAALRPAHWWIDIHTGAVLGGV